MTRQNKRRDGCGATPKTKFCTKGMVGCFMSHRRIWQKVVDDDLPAVVVLEDDVRLVDNFKARLGELMSNLPDDWEVCLLGAIGCVNPVKEPSYMKFYSFCRLDRIHKLLEHAACLHWGLSSCNVSNARRH
eukprot:s1873_g8.t1